jgi:hypothetical protein
MRDIDWWPSSRLAITATVLGLGAHLVLGWQPPVQNILALPGQLFGMTWLLAMVSFAVSEIYLLVLLIPLWIVAILNEWLYQCSRSVARMLLGGCPTVVLNLLGLGGEILLFFALEVVARRFLLPIW